MSDEPRHTADAWPIARSRPAACVAYAACGLTLAYGALKFYWAVGGTALRGTIGFPEEVWRDPWFVALGLWGTVVLSFVGALVALAFVRPWGRRIPRRMLLIPAWAACALLTARGVGGLAHDGLLVTGFIGAPASVGLSVILWDLAHYSPYFAVWGVLLGSTAWYFDRDSGRSERWERST